jgi:hypothetical protein
MANDFASKMEQAAAAAAKGAQAAATAASTAASTGGSGGGGSSAPAVPGKASGGLVEYTGLYKVGERGEELLMLPKGGYVFNNNDTNKLISGLNSSRASVSRAPSSITSSVTNNQGGDMQVVFSGNIVVPPGTNPAQLKEAMVAVAKEVVNGVGRDRLSNMAAAKVPVR